MSNEEQNNMAPNGNISNDKQNSNQNMIPGNNVLNTTASNKDFTISSIANLFSGVATYLES